MKRGNKQKALDVAIPAESKLSTAMLKGREEEEQHNV